MDDALVERVARAISILEHHTTWDLLTPMQQNLYFTQARYALKASGIDGLVEALEGLLQAAERRGLWGPTIDNARAALSIHRGTGG